MKRRTKDALWTVAAVAAVWGAVAWLSRRGAPSGRPEPALPGNLHRELVDVARQAGMQQQDLQRFVADARSRLQ